MVFQWDFMILWNLNRSPSDFSHQAMISHGDFMISQQDSMASDSKWS